MQKAGVTAVDFPATKDLTAGQPGLATPLIGGDAEKRDGASSIW